MEDIFSSSLLYVDAAYAALGRYHLGITLFEKLEKLTTNLHSQIISQNPFLHSKGASHPTACTLLDHFHRMPGHLQQLDGISSTI
jgi:hypothetical protein